jgi:hypothetical protein
MRAQDLIFEYKRDVTARNYAEQLIDRIYSDGTTELLRFPNTAAGTGYTTRELWDYTRGRLAKEKGIPPENVAAMKDIFVNGAIAEIEKADPTSKKAYTEWLVMAYINGIFVRWEDIFSTGTEFLTMYNDLKQRNIINKSDTLRYLSNIKQINHRGRFSQAYNDVMNAHEFYLGAEKQTNKGDVEEVYNGPAVRVIKAKDQTAACYYGRGTQWCTAATRSHNYFDQYNKSGDIYIFLPKNPKYEGEKYQFWAGDDGRTVGFQLMDPEDEPVSLEDWDKRFPGLGIAFLYNLAPDVLKNLVVFNGDMFENVLSQISTVLEQNWKWEIIADWEVNDDYWYKWLQDEGYVDEEGDWDDDKMAKDGVNYLEYNDDLRRGIQEAFDTIEELTPEVLDAWYEDWKGFGEHLDFYHMVDAVGDYLRDQHGSYFESLVKDAGHFIKERMASTSDKNLENFKVRMMSELKSHERVHPTRRTAAQN